MKFVTSLSFFFFLIYTGEAQQQVPSVQWLQGSETPSTYYFAGGKYPSFQTAEAQDNGGIKISDWGKEGTPISSKIYTPKNGEGTPFLILPANGSVFAFYQVKEKQKHTVSALKLNLQAEEQCRKTLETPLDGNKFSDVFFTNSINNSYVLLYTSVFSAKEQRVEWNFAVFSTAECSWVNQAVYYTSFSKDILESVKVDEAGQVLFVAKRYKTSMDVVKNRNAWFTLDLFPKGGTATQVSFTRPGYEIGSVELVSDKKGQMFLSGTAYPEADRSNLREGGIYFLYKLQPTGLSFSDSLNLSMDELMGDTKSKRKGIIPLLLKNIHYDTNGDMILMAEMQQQVISSSSSYFLSNDIYCIRLQSNGSIRQSIRIPRFQDTNTSKTFFSIASGSSVYLLCSDNKQNQTESEKVIPFSSSASKNGLFLITVKEDGTLARNLLVGYEIPDTAPAWYRCQDLGDGTIFISTNKKGGIVK